MPSSLKQANPINSKNILIIASRSDIAGGEIYLLDIFRHLDRTRFNPIVVVPGEGEG